MNPMKMMFGFYRASAWDVLGPRPDLYILKNQTNAYWK